MGNAEFRLIAGSISLKLPGFRWPHENSCPMPSAENLDADLPTQPAEYGRYGRNLGLTLALLAVPLHPVVSHKGRSVSTVDRMPIIAPRWVPDAKMAVDPRFSLDRGNFDGRSNLRDRK